MTDKIIIDGVDVSECINFRDDVYTDEQIKNVCSIGLWQKHYSGLEENCKMSCYCEDNPNCYFKQLKGKEQECEKLKKQYNCNACGTCNGKEDYKNMQKHCEKAIAQNHNYKQALDEIEEQIKILQNRTPLFEVKQIAKDIIKIQNIISEAKEQ